MERVKKVFSKVYSTAEWVVYGAGGGIIGYLTFLVFRYSFNTENSIPIQVNLLLQLLYVILFGTALAAIGQFTKGHTKLRKRITIAAYIITIICVWNVSWSFASQTLMLPGSDQKACYDIALRFLNSEFGAVVPEGSYLSLWPYQTGLIFILEKVMRIFNTTDPLFLQGINCLYLVMMITAGYGIVCSMTEKIEGRLAYLIMMLTYWPLVLRTIEIYGDFPAMSWMMVSGMAYLFYHKAYDNWQKAVWIILLTGATFMASLYKGNSLIYVIALLLVTLVRQLRKRDVVILAAVIITMVMCSGATSLTQKYYEYYADNTCGKGVPAIAFLAEGCQYNGEEAIPGGWNGFHSNTYMNTGYDYEETVRISKEAIEDSLQEFWNNPSFMFSFYHNKILKQWANPTHGRYWGINSLYNTSRDKGVFWVEYVEHQKYKLHTGLEDVHESIVYAVLIFSVLCMLIRKWRGNTTDFIYALPYVAFIGGFLFSLIWEGNTGAVMYYPVLLLPVAIGISCTQRDTNMK